MDPASEPLLEDDPLWYKDAIIYETHVKAFSDSDGDGVGDFVGLTSKLDYLADLGVTAIWVLPFYPSPLRDDGYDIADYMDVHQTYGNLRQFKRFLDEAHAHGLRVITELVINHTSDQHPWFQRAINAPKGSPERDFYVWSDTPERWEETRIIFQDTETSNWTYHHQAEQYYWHRFFSHQPDLNYDNPAVMDGVKEVLDFWMDMGVDGMRLDAIPYLVERDGTNCENLPETHEVLKELRRHLEKNHPNRMFLAEANQWAEDAAAYFGDGDECHMNFHFPLMPRLFMSVRMEDRFPIIDILQQTPEIPENAQWALFLRNHDELTLEMVTDEERDYMYRSYAHEQRMRINVGIRRRLAPLLDNNRRVMELLNGLLFSLPGTPVLYYGDEIGMGDNIYLGDRDGVRTPMQWSADRNAGFSRANPQKLFLPTIIDPEYHFETVNVEAQQDNPTSLLWWMKRLIALRKRHKVFGRGSIRFLYPDNPKVLAYVREHDGERVLVVANLSRFVQPVQLDLADYRGTVPIEMFGRTPFPQIGELPYFLTLGPHSFYWFSLDRVRDEVSAGYRGQEETGTAHPVANVERTPVLTVEGRWQSVFAGQADAIERALPRLLRTRRWFGGKARVIQRTSVLDTIDVPAGDEEDCLLVMVRVEYTEGEPETYAVPVAFAPSEHTEPIVEDVPQAVLARLVDTGGDDRGILFDALFSREFTTALLDAIDHRQHLEHGHGELRAEPVGPFDELRGEAPLDAHVSRAEQSNTSVIFGNRLILKMFRRVEEGPNPDVEISRFLTERTDFANTPPLVGILEYRRRRAQTVTLGILQGFVANEGDAWSYTLDDLGRFYERALSSGGLLDEGADAVPHPDASFLDVAAREIPDIVYHAIGPYLRSAELLGTRTAELHLALASDRRDPEFAPEPFSTLYQRSLYQSMRTLTRKTARLVQQRLTVLDGEDRDRAQEFLDEERRLLGSFERLTGGKITAQRIRTHGDYHLGQVLYTGRDFVIIDFEGEPTRSLGERRLKRSPLRDVAGMLRSFHYAAYAGMYDQIQQGIVAPDAEDELEAWARYWHLWVSAGYLRAYLATAQEGAFLPGDPRHLRDLIDAYLLEKAIYELAYELNNRPSWVAIPLKGIAELLAER